MLIKLLEDGYKNDEEFYQRFLNGTLENSEYVSDESVIIPAELPQFPIYFKMSDKVLRENLYIDMIKVVAEHVIGMDRDIYMDEKFWHSWVCLYQRDYFLSLYPQVNNDYATFRNIIIKPFDWENYIYKAILMAQYVTENTPANRHDHYYHLILQNMDMFNYIIKYEIFRNGRFLINVMDIIEETKLGKILKLKIRNRPDLAADERFGRRVIFEFNKAYPIVMGPMLEKDALKEYFLRYLSYYWKGEVMQDDGDDGEF